MSTCTDLFNAINAIVVDPNLLASIAKADLAVLSNIGTTESIVQLGAGGNALLSMPASPNIEENLFRVVVVGHAFNARASSTQVTLRLYVGTSISANGLLGSRAVTIPNDGEFGIPYAQFYFDLTATWSSLLYRAGFTGQAALLGRVRADAATDTSQFTEVSGKSLIQNQTDLKFFLTAQFASADAGNSVTVSQMILKKV